MKKAATETLDRTVVKRPLNKQNLCLDKGYDYPEIERESTKRRYVPPHIRHRGVEKELIKLRYYSVKRWIVERTNSWHKIQKVIISKVRKEIRELSCTCMFSLLYYCLQENSFGISSY